MHLRNETNLDRHAKEGVTHPHEAARYGHHLPDVSSHRDGNEIDTAHAAVRWIEGDPARTRHIYLCSGMGSACAVGSDHALSRIVEIPRHDPRSESERPHSLDEEDGKVAAGPPSALQSLHR
jgi:hypothetical protein